MLPGRMAIAVVIGLAAGFTATALAVRQRHDPHARRTVVMRAVAESIGMGSLALTSEGGATRAPTEGPAACLGDIPGGFCLRDTCDLVTCPGPFGRPLTLERERALP